MANRLKNDNEHYKGAGVAQIELIDDVPTVTHRFGENGWWWNGDEVAKFGDVAAYRDVNSEYIYIFGNPPNHIQDFPAKLYVYMARVPAVDAFDLEKYEYWWGREQGWKREVLTEYNCETAVMWGVGQGQIVYNEHFGAYIYVHLDLGKFYTSSERFSSCFSDLLKTALFAFELPHPRKDLGRATRKSSKRSLLTGASFTPALLIRSLMSPGRR